MNVFAFDAAWGEKDKIPPEHNFAQPTVFPFGGTNEKPDFATLDVEFFQRLDRLIAHLNEKQIVAHLMIYVWNKSVNWPHPESHADNLYFDYVVKRYQAFPNLIWDISKEALGYGQNDIGYITRRIDRLRQLDGHQRLVTVHDYDYCNAHPDKVDFISIQEWDPYLYDRMVEVSKPIPTSRSSISSMAATRKRPIPFLTARTRIRLRVLTARTSASSPARMRPTTGRILAWYNVISEPFALPEQQQPHFSYYKNLTALFGEYDFNDLRASQHTFSPPMLSNGEDVFLFYLSHGRTGIYGRLDEVKGKTMTIRWFDPLTGRIFDGGKRDFADNSWLGIRRPEEITGSTAIAVLEEVQE